LKRLNIDSWRFSLSSRKRQPRTRDRQATIFQIPGSVKKFRESLSGTSSGWGYSKASKASFDGGSSGSAVTLVLLSVTTRDHASVAASVYTFRVAGEVCAAENCAHLFQFVRYSGDPYGRPKVSAISARSRQ
jgi:hypothetical protein